MEINIKQEIGKWFLDVSKYVLTAMLLTSLISELNQPMITIVTAMVLCVSFAIGFHLLRQRRDEERRRMRNRDNNKHNNKPNKKQR